MKIPKKIHLVWIGGERPTTFDYFFEEIKKINNEYEIIEWAEHNIDFELKNRELFDNTLNLGAKSDILRFEILHKYGGIYMDYDFLQIKNFDGLLDYDFFAGTNEKAPQQVWNSIVGSKPNNPICEKFLDGLKTVNPIGRHEIDRVMNETGPNYLTDLIFNNSWDCNYKVFIGPEFFPFPLEDRFMIRNFTKEDIEHIRSFKTEETYCIHFHTTSWL